MTPEQNHHDVLLDIKAVGCWQDTVSLEGQHLPGHRGRKIP